MWPTSAPTLIAVPRRSIAARNSANDSKGQSVPIPARSASSDMPSTLSSVRSTRSRCAGRVGATPKPQFPITTEVTPCQGEMVSMRSQKTCAS